MDLEYPARKKTLTCSGTLIVLKFDIWMYVENSKEGKSDRGLYMRRLSLSHFMLHVGFISAWYPIPQSNTPSPAPSTRPHPPKIKPKTLFIRSD
jgi:hypothetical protein